MTPEQDPQRPEKPEQEGGGAGAPAGDGAPQDSTAPNGDDTIRTGPEQSGPGQADGTQPGPTRTGETQPGDTARPGAAGSRPRPQYGEYAPEGWQWTPPEDVDEMTAPATATAASAPPAHEWPAKGSGKVPGVPHNLGVRSDGSSGGAPSQTPASQTPQQSGQAPQHRQEQQAPRQSPPPQAAPAPVAGPSSGSPAPAGKNRLADRVITILLLVLGGFGAMYLAAALSSLPNQFAIMADVLGISDPTIPDWLGTLTTVSVFVILALYAVNLIFSIQRLRARKLAFFIPLIAGAVAVILFFVVTTVAMNAVPEIADQIMNDPNGTLEKMLEYASTVP